MTPPAATQPRATEGIMRADARRNRDAIVAAAYELFAEKGTEAQMDDIARHAGLGVGTLYRHFPAKGDLLDAVIVRRFERLAGRAGQAAEQARDGEPWEAFKGYIEWAAEMQAGDRALSEAMATRSERMHAVAVGSGLVEALEQLVEHAKAAGAVREDLVVEDIPALVCSIGAVAAAAIQKPGWRWDRVIAIWLDGVRAPGLSELPGP
jgi:AcrR family transcriptional regulator